ncbi:putative amidoligase enzyme-domain-containing protein [Biscogniauxia marginata]|nr:putative amidoligase enzyme-domain-containing protein [Biscogniauxia marginata]
MDQPVTTGSQPELQSQTRDLSNNMDLINSLKFGVEIETIVTGVQSTQNISTDEFYDSGLDQVLWRSTADKVANSLRRVGINCHVTLADDKRLEQYTEWCIIEEASITDDTNRNRYGIEVVSPVLKYSERHIWALELEKVFTQLRAHDADASHVSCSTHVHISMKDSTWTLENLKKLASAIVYFDAHLSYLAGKVGRADNHWAVPNRDNAALRSLSTAETLRMIDEAQTTFDLLQLMAPSASGCREYQWGMWHVTGLSPYGVAPDDIDDGLRGQIARGAAPIVCEDVRKTGTVECRLPPGSSTSEEAMMWVDFVALFVLAAVGRNAP